MSLWAVVEEEEKELAEILFPIKIKFSLLCFSLSNHHHHWGTLPSHHHHPLLPSLVQPLYIPTRSVPRSIRFHCPHFPLQSWEWGGVVVVVVRPRVAAGASAAWWWWSWWQSWPIHNDQQQGGRRCVIITKIIKTIESLIEIYFPLSLFYRSVGRWVGSNTSYHSVPCSSPCHAYSR